MDKRVSQKAHQDGFVAKIITDKNETFGFGYGFDILECGICKLFKKHNYEKYSSILCEDEKTSSLAGLNLIRTGTIALGAKKCDFRLKKKLLIKRQQTYGDCDGTERVFARITKDSKYKIWQRKITKH